MFDKIANHYLNNEIVVFELFHEKYLILFFS
jgi:hypothetical protein